MQSSQIIRFHEDEILVHDGQVAVNIIAKNIGLDADSAVRNLKNHPILGAEACVRTVQVGENQARNYTFLPTQRIAGWLFSIEAAKVKPEAREKLLAYQRECYQVLHDHFFGGLRKQGDRVRRIYEIKSQIAGLDDQINALKGQRRDLHTEVERLQIENYKTAGLWTDDDTARLPKKLRKQLELFEAE